MKEAQVNGEKEIVIETKTEKPRRHILRTAFIIFAAVILAALLCAGAAIGYEVAYSGKIYPGVYIGDYPLGGMDKESVREFINGLDSRLNKEGLIYIYRGGGEEKRYQMNTTIIESDAMIELISLGSEGAEEAAYQAGRGGNNLWRKYFDPIALKIKPTRLVLPIVVQKEKFIEVLQSQLKPLEKEPRDAGVKITSRQPLQYEVSKEQDGYVFDYEKIVEETKNRLSVLNLEPMSIGQKAVMPKTEARYLDGLQDKIARVLGYGDIILTYVDPDSAETKTGRITEEEVVEWLVPAVDTATGDVWFTLDQEKTGKQLEGYKYILDKAAEESKFTIENGKVNEFRSGSSGQQLNIEKTLSAINSLMQARSTGSANVSSSVSLIVDSAEPKIKLADINNLGITAVIGIGTSTFYDSHTNRIKNIAHAVARLNGTIIAPGEEFSTIRYAGPFTAENGYLPEEVIKGSQIKKEIGGGMCQIGTTLFRMAMNSGMPITERTNHSLVVGYYADPINKNPGTDATVYEPILDFKFLNDTGGYLLLETKIDYKKQLLTFTLWGKPDGRYGFYSRPLVSRWIPAGDLKEIYTTNLSPGEKKCQNAFRGAVASFTYTRFTSSTEKIERVFTSYYRPLPKTCMVGVDPAVCPDVNNCTPPPVGASSTAGTEVTPAVTSTASTTL